MFSLERSTDQVIKPININALSSWVGHIPDDVLDDMAKIAPMLKKLGYDPDENPPNYGKPDSFVLDNMNELDKNEHHWKQKEIDVIKTREEIRKGLLMNRTHHRKSD